MLLIFQAMDAAGKDGAIKHVMSGVNPQGCQVYSFKAPSSEELDHDFLWRCLTRLPERGRIGIFNRSYYEEVLVVRVHPEYPATRSGCRRALVDEAHLGGALRGHPRLRALPGAQRHRDREVLPARLEGRAEASASWSGSTSPRRTGSSRRGDVARARSTGTSTWTPTRTRSATRRRTHAPWYVVPADNKWFTRLVVAAALIDALERLDLKFPEAPAAKELKAARAQLMKEQGSPRKKPD